jgi:hypothetical protein
MTDLVTLLKKNYGKRMKWFHLIQANFDSKIRSWSLRRSHPEYVAFNQLHYRERSHRMNAVDNFACDCFGIGDCHVLVVAEFKEQDACLSIEQWAGYKG